ncbi:MAG: hypothetical protein EPO32_06785 [Anaerolineae bacterium]|nr:MAG: hypothetical protein EPO32_06785 [Anaerolineae bacterium]
MLKKPLEKNTIWPGLGVWLILSALLAWTAPFPHVEELTYLEYAAWPEAEAGLLHHFGHIHLLKAFVALAPSPLWGARLFWGAAVSGILFLLAGPATRLNTRQP